jgi:hypothetical protein
VLAALAAATVGRGGYYRRVGEVGAVLLALAAVVLLGRQRFATLRLGGWALVGLAVMATSTVVAGVLDHHLAGVLGPVALLAGLAVIVAVVAASTGAARRQLTDATLALGVFLAATAWIGVAFHLSPLGHPDGGLWRAATTVTYANAAAAILGPLALWTLARATSHHGSATRCAAVLVLAGLGATLSRAGVASFVAGLLVLSALLGFGVVWRAGGTALVGGLVATAALVPGMPVTSAAKPLLAVFGLAAGLAIGAVRGPGAVNQPRHPGSRGRRLRIGWVVLLAGAAVGVALIGFGGHSRVWSGRLSLSSPDRASLASAALHMWHNHPVSGVGPGRAVFIWTAADHQLVFDRYVHDEYLQIAVEQGLVGLVGLGALAAAAATTAFAGWQFGSRSPSDGDLRADLKALRAGAIAGLVCLAIHSGFDFLWHVPAVPMIAAVAVGLTARLDTDVLSQPHLQPQTKETS